METQQEELSGKIPFFTPREVAAHNRPNVRTEFHAKEIALRLMVSLLRVQDCWVSVNHRVLDLSELVQENLGLKATWVA